ncbi:MAG: glycosyltransferase family 2 protein [Pseudomonadota bacterium]
MSVSKPKVTPVVSIIVVSYNTAQLTADCLRSVARETGNLPYELIVVDNASSDGSVDAIIAAAPTARLIALDENLGFAAANNLAVQEARGAFILLLNPDTVVRDRAISRLVSFARCCPDAGIWGGRTLYGDGSLNATSCHGRMTLWGLLCRASGLTAIGRSSAFFNPEAYGSWPRDRVRGVDIVSGCFLLTRRTLWHELGGLDTRFFMYGEEADFCLRAQALGARPLMTPDAQIIHFGGASERVRSDQMVRLLAAKAELIRRHFSQAQRKPALVLHACWPLSRFIATTVLAGVTGSEARRTAARTWGEIWRRRSEWMAGYSGRKPSLQHPGLEASQPVAAE